MVRFNNVVVNDREDNKHNNIDVDANEENEATTIDLLNEVFNNNYELIKKTCREQTSNLDKRNIETNVISKVVKDFDTNDEVKSSNILDIYINKINEEIENPVISTDKIINDLNYSLGINSNEVKNNDVQSEILESNKNDNTNISFDEIKKSITEDRSVQQKVNSYDSSFKKDEELETLIDEIVDNEKDRIINFNEEKFKENIKELYNVDTLDEKKNTNINQDISKDVKKIEKKKKNKRPIFIKVALGVIVIASIAVAIYAFKLEILNAYKEVRNFIGI